MNEIWNSVSAGMMTGPVMLLSASALVLTLALRRIFSRKSGARTVEFSATAFASAISNCVILQIAKDGRLESWTPAAEALFGTSQANALNQPLSLLLGEEWSARALAAAAETGRYQGEDTAPRLSGSALRLDVGLDRLLDPIGRLAGYALTIRDCTQAHGKARHLETLYANGHRAIDNLPLGIALFDREERLLFHNTAYRQIVRLPQALADTRPHLRETLYFALGRLLQPRQEMEDEVAECYRRLRENLIRPGGADMVETFGEDHAVRISSRMLEEGGFVVALEDISDRLQPERSLAHAARHDAATGLPNQVEFEDYLDDALSNARRKGERLTTLVLDLSRFRAETMRFGSSEADGLLRRLGARLASCLQQGEFLARTGKDRLTVLKAHAQPAEMDALLRRLRAVLGQRFDYQGNALSIPARLEINRLDINRAAADYLLDQAVSELNQTARDLGEGAASELRTSERGAA